MKLLSLLALAIASANANEIFLDQAQDLVATTGMTTETAAQKATALKKKDEEAAATKKKDEATKAAAALKKEEDTKCSPAWKAKNGWTFGCMWDHPGLQIAGCFLMVILITTSNAGGMSGAGSNIPIMLLFFGMDMHQAVPISSFVAVCATGFRFGINFNLKHPTRPDRNVINYEVVTVTMPLVFLGSLIGVKMGPIIGNTAQMCIFGVVVAWSIYISGNKAIQLRREEIAKAAADNGEYMEMVETEAEGMMEGESTAVNAAETIEGKAEDALVEGEGEKPAELSDDPELIQVKILEAAHITWKRMLFYFINFCFLFAAQMVVKNPKNPLWLILTAITIYVIVACLMTRTAIAIIDHLHEVKDRCHYNWDEKDMRFHNKMDIVKMALACMTASILCGMTGIAGGMVLGPLFLKYNMIPVIMSSTNQYITLLASFSVFVQFAIDGEMTWDWAICFGSLGMVSAWIGIVGIQTMIKRQGGKQSLIAWVMMGVLISALIMLPLKAIFLDKTGAYSKLYHGKTHDTDGATVF